MKLALNKIITVARNIIVTLFGQKMLSISDYLEQLNGIGSNLLPPKRKWVAYGKANLFETGLAFFKYFLDFGNLNRNSNVLDIGCSIGRMAYPLTAYLNATARYEGFDIVPSSIAYCRQHISPSFPNFSFQLADIRNNYYNPNGHQESETFVFPYDDNQFDLVFSTSVFTHMYPDSINHYLKEIARVLKPGGHALNTFFLLEKASLTAEENGQIEKRFPYEKDGYRVATKKADETIIAVPESLIREFHKNNCLEIVGDTHYGYWRSPSQSGKTCYTSRKSYSGFQDLIVSVNAE